MRKTFQLFLPIQFLILILAFVIFTYHANSQSIGASVTRDTLNIGYGVDNRLVAGWRRVVD